MKTIVVVMTATLLFPAATVLAKRPIAKHEQRQEGRIEQGVNSGKLTDKEAERLENQQEIIENERENAAEDGKVTRGERREIRHDQRKASNAIRRKKHNERHY